MLRKLLWNLFHRLSSDALFVHATHYRVHGRLPDLADAQWFSDRIAYRRLHPQPLFSLLTDKLEVRDFVRERLGEDALIPLLANVGNMDEVSFHALPSAFVMKASHGSGWTHLVRDKAREDVEALKRMGQDWLGRNFYRANRERQYKRLLPRVMFEPLLLEDGRPARDYKIHCFRRGGHLTQLVQVHSDRFGDHRVTLFTPDWNPIRIGHGFPAAPDGTIERPAQLDALLRAADLLSRAFNYVRVDLYATAGRIYFGEMTFTPAAGLHRFEPLHADRAWARLFDPDAVYYANPTGTRRDVRNNGHRPIAADTKSTSVER